MGLFSVLNVATSGLFASQQAMDISGQNISNADVEGYSRKRLNLSTNYRSDEQFGQVGLGVDMINIERMRNSFIDEQIRRQNQDVGNYTELDNTMQSIENIFNEPADTGIQHYMDQFFDSWQNLANNPSDVSARTMVRTNAEILTDVFHNLSGELSNLRQSRNDELEDRVKKVNEISQELLNLNKEIGGIEVGKQNANDSKDKRDLLLKQLSELIDVTTIENEHGQVTVTTGGSILVSPVDRQELETYTTSFDQPDGTTITDIGIRFANSKRQLNPQGGQIKGLLDSRDVIVPSYQKKLDLIATTLVEKVNELHSQGYNLNGYSGNNFFNELVTGASDIKISAEVASDVANIAASSAGEIKPAVANQLTAGSHNFGSAAVQLVRDPASATPTAAKNIVQGTVVVSTPTVTLKEGVDYNINYASGTIQMLHNGYDTQNLDVNFQYRSGGFQGAGDNSNALKIAGLRSDLTMTPDILGNGTSTFTEYYASVIGELGLNRNEAQSNLDTRKSLVEQYQSQQDSISGVSIDEEMANLIKYQHTYQAAARIISVTSEMLDTLLKM
jgi:flagellar hook-associated protein 1 FlgK